MTTLREQLKDWDSLSYSDQIFLAQQIAKQNDDLLDEVERAITFALNCYPTDRVSPDEPDSYENGIKTLEEALQKLKTHKEGV